MKPNMKLLKYQIFKRNTINLTINYAVFTAIAILVLISAHAKSAHLNDNNLSTKLPTTSSSSNNITPISPTMEPSLVEESVVIAPATTSQTINSENQQEKHKEHQQHQHQQSKHHQHQLHHHQRQHHKHNQQQQQKHQQQEKRKHHSHYHRHNMLTTSLHESYFDKRPYHSKFTIEELLNTKFSHKISNDIDMDPCKAGGFMGDIALPDINYSEGGDPIVAHTATDTMGMEWQMQSDAAEAPEKIPAAVSMRFNTTFQHELEILKQEVYHEGLQVEEEGLTHIIRKKTKLPNANTEYNSNNDRNRNDPTLSANEPVKPTGGYSLNSDYLMKNLKNEIISSSRQQQQQRRKSQGGGNSAASYSMETEYFEPKIAVREKPISVDIGGNNNKNNNNAGGASSGTNTGTGTMQQRRHGYNNGIMTTKGGTTTFDANGKIESIALHRSSSGVIESGAGTMDEIQKLNKSATAVLNNRNVDQRKIQSNTKDIEDDSGNNFVAERKVVILPTSLPAQRSTLPNVYSNAGGNGMKLDDVEILHADGVVQRRRHRRGRKNRRSSDVRNEFNARLQRLKEELNRPVRTMKDFHIPQKQKQQQKNQQHQQQKKKQHYANTDATATDQIIKKHVGDDLESKIQSRISNIHYQPKFYIEEANNFNYSSKNIDELEVLTKRKSTMDAITAEVHDTSSLEMELEKAENLKHLTHHHRMARAVTAKKERVWDYGVIPYEIDGNFSGLHKALFKQAMRHWENSTCIKFVERDPEIHPNYIVFTVRSCGCCSFVGKRGNGAQAISIGRNCDKFGIVVHELGHVVGFWHEHTRPDREKHVVIELNNIMKGQDYNFNKLTPDEVDSLGMAYDYDSIMHYARNTFSKGTYLDTILPVDMKGRKRPEIGQRLRLSAGDIAQANLLYKCPKCGRTFQDNTGTFASPSYYTAGALTNETEHCEWRITATHGERVVLRLENLNIFKSNNCQTDYLEVRDGYYFKSPLIGRFCGKMNGEILKTESSRMLVTYVNTHRTDGYRGIKAEYEVICGGELSVEDSDGRLESPNYPLDYLASKECVWKISVPKGYQVALKFQSFEVENHDSCIYDYVEIRDGSTQDSPLVGVFCGYKPPPNMKSSGNTMFVKFVSDASVQKAGFSAIFMTEVDECETQNHGCEHDCINTLGGYECSCHIGYELHSDKKHCEDACGGVIEYPNGTITSPSFPDMYPVLKDCIWEIIAPPKHKISLNFTHFDLEGNTHQQSDCGYDSVMIYSKLSENRLVTIGTYCGSSIPPTATSEGNALRIEFHSDKSIQRSGFAAVFFTDTDECSDQNGGCQHVCHNTIGSYKCSCNNGYSLHENGHDCKEGECKYEISAPFGTIYSPNYPNQYPPMADCVWHFITTPGHRIKLIFNEFNLESHQECNYDNLAIYDGESESSSIMGRFCGEKIPYPISSSSNQLYMVFNTDSNKDYGGFVALHSTSCGGYLRATNQIQQFYSHSRYGNHNYNENTDCEWTIQAPPSSNVQLLFLTFDVEPSDNCTYDYVQVYSGMEDTSGPMYGQYCGNTLPQDIISLTDSLLVRFKTDISISAKGFSASYVAVDPFDNSDEDINSYSAERATPFPGSLKTIYEDSDDYSDFSENQLFVRSRNKYQNGY